MKDALIRLHDGCPDDGKLTMQWPLQPPNTPHLQVGVLRPAVDAAEQRGGCSAARGALQLCLHRRDWVWPPGPYGRDGQGIIGKDDNN